jgi:Carboxypeptidase regulatory-like domain
MWNKTRTQWAGALAVFVVSACSTMQTQPENAASSATSAGTVTVTGRVTTREGTPVANARVYVPGTGEATRTDANGNYVLAGVPDGPQRVVVRSRGYAPTVTDAKFSVKPSDSERNQINVTLSTPEQAVLMASMQSSDSAGLSSVGFLQREATARGGYFISPEDIREMKPNTVSDIFRTVPVVTEVPGAYGPVLRGIRGCLLVYVDGLPWRSMFPGDLNTDIQARDVVAAEVYPPGQTPPSPFVRGRVRSNCTTVGIWTRSGLG